MAYMEDIVSQLSLLEENKVPPAPSPLPKGPSLRPLYPDQAKIVPLVRQAILEGHKRIIVQAPCGWGKTLWSAHLIDAANRKGKRSIFTCPAINLINQTLEAFEAEGIKGIGVIQAKHERTNWVQPIQIASIQTLIRRAMPEVDLIIQDEAHQIWEKWNERLDSDEWKNKVVIGVTATPWAKGMGLRWTKLIIAATIREMIDNGRLTPFRIYAPAEEADLTTVRTTAGDYNEGDLSRAMDKPRLVADVVKTWLEKADNRPTFLYGVDCKHAQSLQKEFQDAGVPCGYMDAYSEPEGRQETLAQFRDGRIKIIASVGTLITGIDEDVRCLIVARPTKSETLHVQMVGRALRLADGKADALILDHAGNTLRLGMVTDIHHETLDIRKKGDKEAPPPEKTVPKPKKCPNCRCVMPPTAKVCPSCHQAVIFQSDVMVEDGELVEFGSGKKSKIAKTDLSRQEWYSSFLSIAEKRGHTEGWAAWRYKERFGVFPRGLEKVAAKPSLEVLNFETYARIKFSRGHQQPTPRQVELCKKIGLEIPAGTNSQKLRGLIDVKMGVKK